MASDSNKGMGTSSTDIIDIPYAEPIHYPGQATQDYNTLAHRIAHPFEQMDSEHNDHGLSSQRPRAQPGEAGAAGPASDTMSEHSNKFDEMVKYTKDSFSNMMHAIGFMSNDTDSNMDTVAANMNPSSPSSKDSEWGKKEKEKGEMEESEKGIEETYGFTKHPSEHNLNPPMDDIGTDFSLWQPPAEEPEDESEIGGDMEQHNESSDQPELQQKAEQMAREGAARKEEMAEGK